MKTKYHIYNQSFLNPILRSFNDSGANIYTTAKKSSIKKFDFNRPGSYLPQTVLYDFLMNLVEDHGVYNLASEFYPQMSLDELGEFGGFISECDDMLTVILDGIKYESVFQTNTRMHLDVKGTVSRFSQFHLDPPSRGRELAEDIVFVMALKAFKMVLGDNWNPKRLYVPRESAQWIEKMIDSNKVNVLYGHSNYAWDFDTKYLSSKNIVESRTAQEPLVCDLGVSDKVSKILESYGPGHIPTLTDFSDSFNISERTIVRNLSEEGVKYSVLLERSLFKRALNLLSNNNIKINEVSWIIGFSNTQNFIRAFKKWTKTTPGEYRRELYS